MIDHIVDKKYIYFGAFNYDKITKNIIWRPKTAGIFCAGVDMYEKHSENLINIDFKDKRILKVKMALKLGKEISLKSRIDDFSNAIKNKLKNAL